jgi:hypothetical protein
VCGTVSVGCGGEWEELCRSWEGIRHEAPPPPSPTIAGPPLPSPRSDACTLHSSDPLASIRDREKSHKGRKLSSPPTTIFLSPPPTSPCVQSACTWLHHARNRAHARALLPYASSRSGHTLSWRIGHTCSVHTSARRTRDSHKGMVHHARVSATLAPCTHAVRDGCGSSCQAPRLVRVLSVTHALSTRVRGPWPTGLRRARQ